MPETVIEVRDLTKTYHLGDVEVHALRGVSLIIERGEFIAIMGASGSGKSTLMNVIGCLDGPTSGTYLLEGVDVASLGEPELAGIRSRRIGFVFQSFNLLSRTSALENVELPLLYSGDMAETERRARASLKLLGLEGRERNHTNQLSGGQQQRVAIARALINDPAILLADEPTGNLDSVTSSEIMTTLQRLNRERGLTVVLVTHDPEVAHYADRVVTVRDGLIVSDQLQRAQHVSVPEPFEAKPSSRTGVAAAVRGAVGRVAALRHHGAAGGGSRAGAQQAALRADDARHLHRRRGLDRDGRGWTRCESGGAGPDREPRHQLTDSGAWRGNQQWRTCGIRQSLHLDRGRCGGASERRSRGTGDQLPRSPVGAGRKRQYELEHQHQWSHAHLPANSQLAGDLRPRFDAGGRKMPLRWFACLEPRW